VRDQLVASNGTWFGVDPAGLDLEKTGNAEVVALLSGRTLPDGRALPRTGSGDAAG
jgi:hypothetical protein